MLNNRKGFSLIEVLAALAIFTVMVSALFPVLIHVYRERVAIEEEHKALDLLHNRIQLFLLEGTVPDDTSQIVHDGSTDYRVTFKAIKGSDRTKVCVAWTASNERRYRKCGYMVIQAATP